MDTNDKMERLSEMLGHPEKFTEKQIEDVLSDDECREAYNALAAARQAMTAGKTDSGIGMPDIDEEWERFSARRRRGARKRWKAVAAACAAVIIVSGMAFAAISITRHQHGEASTDARPACVQAAKSHAVQHIEEKTDTLKNPPTVFDNVELQSIMDELSRRYGINVVFKNDRTKHLRMYLNIGNDMTVDDIIGLIDHFDNVKATKDGKTVTIE